MNTLIQPKKTTPLLLITSVLGCLMLSGVANAQTTSVHIVDGRVSGLLPPPVNITTTLVIQVTASGSDGLLEGNATTTPFAGDPAAHNVYEISGSITGSSLVLSGTVTQSTASIVGSPVLIEANALTGQVHITLGPITGGLFVGQTIEFFGSARIIVTSP
jgi:hypothetical protein